MNSSPSAAVIMAVAEATGRDPLELHPPLGDLLDADALDRVCARQGSTVSFEAWDCRVRVDSDGVHIDTIPHSPLVTVNRDAQGLAD